MLFRLTFPPCPNRVAVARRRVSAEAGPRACYVTWDALFLAARRAMVMISGLVSVSGLRSQSPYCSSICKPASDMNNDKESASRNLNVLRLRRGRSQLGLLKVTVNETISPSTGVSTWCAILTIAPESSTISTALSGVQASHPRALGFRTRNGLQRQEQSKLP